LKYLAGRKKANKFAKGGNCIPIPDSAEFEEFSAKEKLRNQTDLKQLIIEGLMEESYRQIYAAFFHKVKYINIPNICRIPNEIIGIG